MPYLSCSGKKVVNFEYSNFENLTSKKCLKSGELSSPLSAYVREEDECPWQG